MLGFVQLAHISVYFLFLWSPHSNLFLLTCFSTTIILYLLSPLSQKLFSNHSFPGCAVTQDYMT